MGLGPKLESPGSGTHKSVVAGPRVNMTRLNNTFSLTIDSACHLFDAVLATRLWNQGQGRYGSIKLMIRKKWMYTHISYKIQLSPSHKKKFTLHFLCSNLDPAHEREVQVFIRTQ